MVGLMADKKYLITVTAFDDSKLDKRLPFSGVPDAVGAALDGVAPRNVLDTQKVFLLTADQLALVTLVLEQHSLHYPDLIKASEETPPSLGATVLYLYDRRQRMQNPGDDTHPV